MTHTDPDDEGPADRMLPLGWQVRSKAATPHGYTLGELADFVTLARAAGLPGTSVIRVEVQGFIPPYRVKSIRTAQPRDPRG